MKLFISWSRPQAREIARALKECIQTVVPMVQPFLSTEDIESGKRWGEVLDLELSASDHGVLVITPENLRSEWIHFEAGALAKPLGNSRVVPMLYGLDHGDVQGPLSRLNGVKADREGVWKLIGDLAKDSGDTRPDSIRRHAFDSWWERVWSALQIPDPEVTPSNNVRQSTNELLDQLFKEVRDLRQLVETDSAPNRSRSARKAQMRRETLLADVQAMAVLRKLSPFKSMEELSSRGPFFDVFDFIWLPLSAEEQVEALASAARLGMEIRVIQRDGGLDFPGDRPPDEATPE